MIERKIQSKTVNIHAPIEFVWSVLTDTSSYKEWNTFTPELECDFEVGSPAHLKVRLWPGYVNITETVSAFEPPTLLAWRKEFGSEEFLVAKREQRLKKLTNSSCEYYNVDILKGLGALLVEFTHSAYIRQGFNDVCLGLKEFCENSFDGTTIASS